jgi:hypothetical protein
VLPPEWVDQSLQHGYFIDETAFGAIPEGQPFLDKVKTLTITITIATIVPISIIITITITITGVPHIGSIQAASGRLQSDEDRGHRATADREVRNDVGVGDVCNNHYSLTP